MPTFLVWWAWINPQQLEAKDKTRFKKAEIQILKPLTSVASFMYHPSMVLSTVLNEVFHSKMQNNF